MLNVLVVVAVVGPAVTHLGVFVGQAAVAAGIPLNFLQWHQALHTHTRLGLEVLAGLLRVLAA